MPLSCTCYDNDDAAWYWWRPDDFTILNTKRSRVCCSCKQPVLVGSECLEFTRTRRPRNDIEERIYGDDIEAVPLAPWYMCESCGEQYLNLSEYGYCVNPNDNMHDLLAEHRNMHGIAVEA